MNDQMRNSFTSVAPPIVASPAKRIQALTGDPDFSGVSLRATYTLQPSSGQGIFCDGMENYPTPCR